MGGMMTMERIAIKIIDLVADARLGMSDIDRIGFHVVENAKHGARKNVLALADSIMYHDGHPYYGDDEYVQDTLF
jgi:hypothetical protein